MRWLLPVAIMVAGLAAIAVVLSWKWRGSPKVRRRVADVANGRKPRRLEGLLADPRMPAMGYAGVLVLFDDELVWAPMSAEPPTHIPLAAIRDVTQIRSDLALQFGAMDSREWAIKVEWPEGTRSWNVLDADAWVSAIAGAR